ncbi:hypothetical protein BVC80_1837g285 [Macleaya cordata]|uniref:Uncharacterized protein n=1 Tax=Macleaya cordata TaxID=56857 RepID=A0A200R416_MACCD|nr:hypothetical protein BVC80_1837g285 [Macleaya cordata]
MKNLYHKNKDKGKVYPSPSSFAPNKDALSMLNLLPAAILALASVLSLEDREVLGYLITRSVKTTNPSSSSSSSSSKVLEEKNKCKKTSNTHKPLFDCGCFDCYTSYWCRWDSSPNRELIHQVIEAFEEYLTKGELTKNNNGRGKKKDKMGRRGIEKSADKPKKRPETSEKFVPILPEPELELKRTCFVPKDDIMPVVEFDKAEYFEENKEDDKECEMEEVTGKLTQSVEETTEQLPAATTNNKGLVSKVLPDVLGILNSRIWSLWSPNV